MKTLNKKNTLLMVLIILFIVIILGFFKLRNNIHNITIKYSKISEYYDEYNETSKIEVSSKDYKKITKFLNKIKDEGSIDQSYRVEALLLINDDYSITIGEDLFGLRKDLKTNKAYIVSYPKELYDIIKDIIEKSKAEEKELLFTLKSSKFNCPSPILKVYKNNTYDYYESYIKDNEDLIQKSGTYNFNINDIISDINNYVESDYNGYTLEYDDKIYSLSEDYIPIKDFLNSIKKNLHKCIHEEKELLFILKSTLLKCPSPVLYVFDNNTYEYFYKNIIDEDNNSNPLVGNYEYDINRILNNISMLSEVSDSNLSAYKLDYNNNTYLISDNFLYIKEFLESIDINLHTCSDVALN